MLDDVVKTVKSQLYDRLNSPLSSTFIIAWCLWNWRFILLLVSDINVLEKFSHVETKIYPSWYELFTNGIFCPLITTILVIFVYPIPSMYVYEYSRNQQKKLKEIRQKIDDEMPLTKEEAKEIRHRVFETEHKYESERKQREERIKELEMELDQRVSKTNELERNYNQQIAELGPIKPLLSDEKLFVLKQVSNGISRRDKLFEGMTDQERVLTERNIRELIKNNLLRELFKFDGIEAGGGTLELLPDGVKILKAFS